MIELPHFQGSHCIAMMFCARIQGLMPKIAKLVAKIPRYEDALSASSGKGSNLRRVMLYGGGSGKSRKGHVHVNIFGKTVLDGAPTRNSKEAEIQSILQQFVGCKAKLTLNAFFMVAVPDLPENGGIVRPAISLDAQIDNIVIKQTGAKLKIVRGAVDSVDWVMRPDGAEVRVQLEANRDIELSETYLLDGYNLTRSAFDVLILDKAVNHG